MGAIVISDMPDAGYYHIVSKIWHSPDSGLSET